MGKNTVICPCCTRRGSLQRITPRYVRVRHYKAVINNKSTFTYCVLDRDLTEKALGQINNTCGQNTIDHLEKPIRSGQLNLGLDCQEKRLGSLARWGSALVRRGSRVRIPPEAPYIRNRTQIGVIDSHVLIPIDSQIIREIFAYCMYQVFPLIPTVSNVMFDSVVVASLLYESFNSTCRTYCLHLQQTPMNTA